MIYFLDLPTELHKHLIAHLIPRADLAALCLVSRYLLSLAQPLLYSAYLENETFPLRVYLKPRETKSRGVKPVRHFLRTILTRPDLASKVKVLSLRPFGKPINSAPNLCNSMQDPML